MTFAVSTRWNACRHTDGEALVEDIALTTGLHRVELGYDLTRDLVPGVVRMVRQGAVTVGSVHNYCPVPTGAPQGHPELFVLADRDRRVREAAVRHTLQTVAFAAELGANAVVCHAGYVHMRRYTPRLVALAREGQHYEPKYEKLKNKLLLKRERHAGPHLEWLEAGIEALLPELEKARVALAFENLPTWEAIPTELEIEKICARFASLWVRAWYDIGHGQIRHNLGLVAQRHWIERLAPILAGFHLHDVIPPAHDHVMPPDGKVDFESLAAVIPPNVHLVIEPSPNTPPEILRRGVDHLQAAWARAAAKAAPPTAGGAPTGNSPAGSPPVS